MKVLIWTVAYLIVWPLLLGVVWGWYEPDLWTRIAASVFVMGAVGDIILEKWEESHPASGAHSKLTR